MKRLRRASVILAFSLLTSAATASAECAWVVWFYSHEFGQSELDRYGVERAFPTRQECVENVKIFAALLKKGGYTLRGEGDPEAIGQRGSELLKYFCLPDAVDPRGPKAK